MMTEDPVLDLLDERYDKIPPLELKNGFKVMAAYIQDNGPEANGIARFTGSVLGMRFPVQDRGENYAVWYMHYDARSDAWECDTGDYFDNLEMGRYMLGRRVMMSMQGSSVRGARDYNA